MTHDVLRFSSRQILFEPRDEKPGSSMVLRVASSVTGAHLAIAFIHSQPSQLHSSFSSRVRQADPLLPQQNMFRTFDPDNDVSTSTQVKSSVQRHIKQSINESHPALTEAILDVLVPKKPPLTQYKVGPHLMLYCRGEEPVFFQQRDGPILPTLKFVQKYPNLEFTRVTADRGAIPFILGGAHIMCPGLTSPGGEIPEDGVEQDAQGFDVPGLEAGRGVVIYAEGKEHAIAVGVMKLSSAEIREKNKGVGIEVAHHLGDGLWNTSEIQ